jgi:hypothetical protein
MTRGLPEARFMAARPIWSGSWVQISQRFFAAPDATVR